MRRPFARPLFVLLACVAVSLASCSSKNKGKIEGRWKSTSEIDKIPAGLATAEFKADGSFTMYAASMPLLNAKYKLGTGDAVNLSDVTTADGKTQKPARVKITITGDNMKWTEDKGTYDFVREKPGDAK